MTPRKTRIAIEPEYTFFVEPRQLRLDAHLKYTIHGAKTSSLEIALPGWQVDEIGPEGAVDGDAELGNAGPVFSVPLLHPTSGELEVTIKRTATWRRMLRSWKSPCPFLRPTCSAPL